MEKKLSVHIITYNHKDFIKNCIEGVLEQKTSFGYEVVIGDDCSTDGTREILLEYKARFPKKVKLILFEKRNAGVPGKVNFVTVLKNCTGNYIALCDGDDYWCDQNKLQRQVDFLEENPEYSMCFHRVYKLGEKGDVALSHLNPEESEITYTMQELAKKNIIHVPSVVFRNNLFGDLPSWFNECPVGDYVLHMLNAQHGLIKYFPQPMAVYRKHGGGVWSTLGMQKGYEKWIQVLNLLLREEFEPAVKENLLLQRRSYAEQLLQSLMNAQQWTEFIEKITAYAAEDEYIAKEWAVKYYPRYINKITGGRSYKFVNKLRKGFDKIKGKKG